MDVAAAPVLKSGVTAELVQPEEAGVTAQLSDGVLTVNIPKSETARPHHIEISG
jgi:HSP20 family molecular chaperone IbpA